MATKAILEGRRSDKAFVRFSEGDLKHMAVLLERPLIRARDSRTDKPTFRSTYVSPMYNEYGREVKRRRLDDVCTAGGGA